MGPHLRPMKLTALLLVAVETVALIWIYYAFGIASRIRLLASAPALHQVLLQILVAVQAVVPHSVSNGVAGFVSASGVGASVRILATRGASATVGIDPSSLGGSVVGPLYLAARRLLGPEGSLSRRVTARTRARRDLAANANLLEPVVRVSTAVQETL